MFHVEEDRDNDSYKGHRDLGPVLQSGLSVMPRMEGWGAPELGGLTMNFAAIASVPRSGQCQFFGGISLNLSLDDYRCRMANENVQLIFSTNKAFVRETRLKEEPRDTRQERADP